MDITEFRVGFYVAFFDRSDSLDSFAFSWLGISFAMHNIAERRAFVIVECVLWLEISCIRGASRIA